LSNIGWDILKRYAKLHFAAHKAACRSESLADKGASHCRPDAKGGWQTNQTVSINDSRERASSPSGNDAKPQAIRPI
jgi:hypothetical protein